MNENISNMFELLRRRAEHQGDKAAYTFLADGETVELKLTYGELDKQSRAIAAFLQKEYRPGARVLLLYPPGLEFISAFFGCLYAAVIPVPVFPPDPSKLDIGLTRLQKTIADSQPALIFTTNEVLKLIKLIFPARPDLEKMIWKASDTIEASLSSYWSEPKISSETLFSIFYTSGSSGDPKGVMISHGNMLHNVQGAKNVLPSQNADYTGVTWMPFYHIAGLTLNILLPMYFDTPCVMMSPLAFLEKPVRWLKAISRYKAGVSAAPNFAYDLCLNDISTEELQDIDLSCWEIAITSTEPVQAETIQRFTEKFQKYGLKKGIFYPIYGATEMSSSITGKKKTPLADVTHYADKDALEQNLLKPLQGADKKARTIVSCGENLFADQKIIIVDTEELKEAQTDQIGEIWISGPSVSQGYWNKAEETEKTFKARLKDSDNTPYYRSGDLGFIKDGELFITGRLKEVIIIRGKNHYPQDIELTVRQANPSPLTNDCAAFSIEVNNQEKLVVIQEIGADQRRDCDTEKIIDQIRSAVSQKHRLQVYAVALIEPDTILKTAGNKIQRPACRAAFLNDDLALIRKDVLEISSEKDSAKISNIQRALGKLQSSNERRATLTLYLQEKAAASLRLPVYQINAQKTLSSFGFDSITVAKFKNQIDADLKIDLPLLDFFEKNLTEASEIIEKILAGTFSSGEEEIDFLSEAALDPEMEISKIKPEKNKSPAKIFLTGSSGFLGVYLLAELLKQTKAEVYCLTRGADLKEASDKIRKQLEKYSLRDPKEEHRIVPLLGDLTKEFLGLSEKHFNELAGQIDLIYHNGALVNFTYPYSFLKAANVDATGEIIKLAFKRKLKPLHYISTIGVFELSSAYSKPGKNIIREADTLKHDYKLEIGYLQSKWIAEKMVFQAREKGLPAVIYRPARITGDSKSGICNTDDLFARAVKGCVQLGAAPKLEITDHLTPVDYVGEAIVNLSLQKASLGKAFHLANPESSPFSQNIRFINDFGYFVKETPYQEWRMKLVQESEKNELGPLLPLFSVGLPDKIRNLKIDSQNAIEALAKTNISCSPPKELLKVYFSYFVESGFLPSANSR